MKASETKKKNLDRLFTSFKEHKERLTEQERIMGRWSGVEKDYLKETKKGDWLQPRDAPKTSDEFMRAAADSEVGTQAHRDLTSSETGGSRGGEIRATDRAVPIEETVGAVVGGKAATAKGAEAPGPSLGKSSKATTGGGDEGKSQGADAKATESALDPLSDQKAKAKWVHEKHSKIDKNEESIKKLTGRNSELLQASKNPAVFVLEAELRTEVLEGMAKEIEENECKISELKKDIKIVETEIKTEVEIPRSSGNSLDRKKKPMEKPQEPPPDVT
jgi:hypothetical protein